MFAIEQTIYTFAENSFVAHFFDKCSKFVVVNKFGVSENFWFLFEIMFNALIVFLYLTHKLIFVVEKTERVVISFG